MRRYKSTLLKLLPMLLIVFVVIGCSGGNEQVSTTPDPDGSGESSEGETGGGTLIIGMTAAALPTMGTSPSQGAEGSRFVGFQLYDGLTRWDLTQGEHLPEIVPALAESWEAPEGDSLTWTFYLREDVYFHDGTHFDADAVIFNFDRLKDQDFEYYSAQDAAGASSRMRVIESYEKVDDYTITITTTEPWSILETTLAQQFFASPTAVMEHGDNYLEHPSGTGPFKYESKVDGQELILVPNENYWGEVPKLDRLILKPMAEPSTRVAALLSGEINWAEAPSPESVARLESEGFDLITGEYDHIFFAPLNQDVEELQDVRVRQAINFAIDRESLTQDLIMGLGSPSTQSFYRGHAMFSEDAIQYTYDPDRARELLAEAGYADGFSGRVMIPASGSGHMWPLPMMEFIQQNLADVGIDIQIDVMEWQALYDELRSGFPNDRDALFWAWGQPIRDADSMRDFVHSDGRNVSNYYNPDVDALIDQAFTAYDAEERYEIMREVSRITTDEAAALFIVHDLNSRAFAPNVKGFVQPQSWYADLTTVTVE